MITKLYGLLLLILLPGILLAQPTRIIALHNRPASEILPIIQPLLRPTDGISADGFNLLLRCDNETFTQVTALLKQLDTAPTNLIISVKTPVNENRDRTHLQLHRPPQVSDLKASTSTRSTNNIPRIRALEGKPALIRFGRSVAYPNRVFIRNGNRIIEQQTQEYLPIDSGLLVTAQLAGEEVILDIEVQQQELQNSQNITHQRLTTTIRGKLGEWLALGGLAQTEQRTTTGIIYHSTEARQNDQSLYIKVERAESQSRK